jgi:cell division protein FtsB
MKILIAFIVSWLFFLVGKTLYENWRVNKEVVALQQTIEETEQANREMKARIKYYQSDDYKEKIARERFGLQKPGEEVVIIVPENKPAEVEEVKKDDRTNYQKWWDYFFGA